MVIAINPSGAFDYVCRSERELPESQRTVWHLRCLTVAEEVAMFEAVTREQDAAKQRLMVLRAGIVGADNFLDETGAAIKWEDQLTRVFGLERRVPTDAWLSRVPTMVRTELANAITAQRVNEDDRGKS